MKAEKINNEKHKTVYISYGSHTTEYAVSLSWIQNLVEKSKNKDIAVRKAN